ncbi:MAG: hypothetical protein JSV86_16940 [Gemmatimonadota bacterium]|nr:MAG: hypothetical protein JSV86_16940 [Gemmatimonadota bacterium]
MSELKEKVKSGYVILDASTAYGGVKYRREVLEQPTPAGTNGEGERKVWKTERMVDHRELVDACDRLVKQVDYALRKHASRTSFGWFADADQYAAIKARVAEIAAEAEGVNRTCAEVGCQRRCHIAVVPARLDLATPDAASEVYRTITTQLTDLKRAVRAGEVGRGFDNLLTRAKNLDKLAVGFAGESIGWALDRVKEARREVRDKIKRGQTPESAGKQVDLDAVDAAIAMFVPMDESVNDVIDDGVGDAGGGQE